MEEWLRVKIIQIIINIFLRRCLLYNCQSVSRTSTKYKYKKKNTRNIVVTALFHVLYV